MGSPEVTIHYARNVIRDLRAACGSRMRADTDRFSNWVDVVDCEACLATDECRAQVMELALTTKEQVPE